MENKDVNSVHVKAHRHPMRVLVSGVSKDGTTVKVESPRMVVTPKYGKRFRRHSVLFASLDSAQVSGVVVGGYVEILPTRRVSKTKSWRVVSVVS
jgi:ribosomal protein S17